MQREFEKVIKEHIQKTTATAAAAAGEAQSLLPGGMFDRTQRGGAKRKAGSRQEEEEEPDAIVHDLEEASSPVKNSVQTISHHVSLANGHLKNNNDQSRDRKEVTMANGFGPQANGHLPNGKMNFRNMLEEADNYPIHSYM